MQRGVEFTLKNFLLLYKGVLSGETLDTTNHPLYNELIFRSSLIILNEEGFLTKEAIYKYVKEQYGAEPEYLWKRDPNSAVFRHRYIWKSGNCIFWTERIYAGLLQKCCVYRRKSKICHSDTCQNGNERTDAVYRRYLRSTGRTLFWQLPRTLYKSWNPDLTAPSGE